MFEDGFPKKICEDVNFVSNMIKYNKLDLDPTEQSCLYLIDGKEVKFPYRIYYKDKLKINELKLSSQQNVIYHCIFSRSCDGFVREKHIKELLSINFPRWAIPYIIKICDEYVVEILETVYNQLQNKCIDEIKTICKQNLNTFCLSHDRMISYWNEFYRYNCFRYKDYIGKKLFEECFGYTRSMEKLRMK